MRSGSSWATWALVSSSTLLGRQFVLGRDPDHVARLQAAPGPGLQDDVQRLVPGHVLQAQRHVAGDGVAGHHVEVGEVGNHLQQRANLDVLEVQRQFSRPRSRGPASVCSGRPSAGAPPARTGCRLVGAVLPVAARVDGHAHAVTLLRGGDALHRRAEVGDVETLAQAVRQRGSAGNRPPGSGPAGGCRRRPGCWGARRRSLGRRRRCRGGSRCPERELRVAVQARRSAPAHPRWRGRLRHRGGGRVEHQHQRLSCSCAL